MPSISLSDYGDILNDKGIPGMDVDINISSIVNYSNGSALVDFGVAIGVDANGILATPAAGNVVGITMRHPVFTADINGNELYPPHAAIPVMEFGRVWAICVSGCNVGDAVSCQPDGTVTVGGAIPIDGAFWDSKAAAGEIAIVRLNRIKLPAGAVTETQPPARESAARDDGARDDSSLKDPDVAGRDKP